MPKKIHSQEEVDEHLRLFREQLGRQFAYPGGKGSGVVIVGGGCFWPGIVVSIRMLRETVSDLPVQVWHRGRHEPVRDGDVVGLGVELIDGTGKAKHGWGMKTAALLGCPWENVLYLDADAYVVENPDPLPYSPAGFAFWSESAENVQWGKVWPAGPAGVPPIQGGQLAINRRKIWRELNLAHWLNQHSDFYYDYMFGDQDCWRVAFAATGTPWQCLGKAEFRNPAYVCSWEGKPLIVHRCKGKLFPDWCIPPDKPYYGKPFAHLPKEELVFKLFGKPFSLVDCPGCAGRVRRKSRS